MTTEASPAVSAGEPPQTVMDGGEQAGTVPQESGGAQPSNFSHLPSAGSPNGNGSHPAASAPAGWGRSAGADGAGQWAAADGAGPSAAADGAGRSAAADSAGPSAAADGAGPSVATGAPTEARESAADASADLLTSDDLPTTDGQPAPADSRTEPQATDAPVDAPAEAADPDPSATDPPVTGSAVGAADSGSSVPHGAADTVAELGAATAGPATDGAAAAAPAQPVEVTAEGPDGATPAEASGDKTATSDDGAFAAEVVAAEVAEQLGAVVGEDVEADPAEFAAAAVLDVLRASGWADAAEANELRAESSRLRELLAEVVRDHRARVASMAGVENQQLHWLVPLLRAAHGVAFGSLGAKVALRTAVQDVPPEVLASAGLRIDYGVEPEYEEER
jgi:hypothetical protein